MESPERPPPVVADLLALDVVTHIQQTFYDTNLPTVTRFAEAMTAVATVKRHAWCQKM